MIKQKILFGGAGYRSRYLSHAKRALYHLSYTPIGYIYTRIFQICRYNLKLFQHQTNQLHSNMILQNRMVYSLLFFILCQKLLSQIYKLLLAIITSLSIEIVTSSKCCIWIDMTCYTLYNKKMTQPVQCMHVGISKQIRLPVVQ